MKAAALAEIALCPFIGGWAVRFRFLRYPGRCPFCADCVGLRCNAGDS